ESRILQYPGNPSCPLAVRASEANKEVPHELRHTRAMHFRCYHRGTIVATIPIGPVAAKLEVPYWPEWNERFALPLTGMVDMHRALTPQIDLASALSHVEQRVVSNDYTFSFWRPALSDRAPPSQRCTASALRRPVCGGERVRSQGASGGEN